MANIPGFTPQIARLVSMMNYARSTTLQAVAGLGVDELDYLAERDRWYILWMMANVEGHTELEAQVVDGEVHTTGKGRDPMGELIERGRYHDISGDGYSFTLDRSNDGGKTWIRPFVSFRATRRKAAECAAAQHTQWSR